MLIAKLRASDFIHTVTKTQAGVLLQSERGTLRLCPVADDICRVSYTVGGEPATKTPAYILPAQPFAAWEMQETDTDIICRAKHFAIRVNRATGALQYEDTDCGVLLRDRERESRTLEPFDAYRMVVDENTVIEEVETPDGVKKVVREATRVLDRTLYHTRLHLCFAEGEALYGLGQHEEGCLNLRGTTQYLHQANLKIALPVLVSSKGYGIVLSTGSPALFNDTAAGSYLYTEADTQMDYYFLAGGGMAGTVAAYRRLTGKAALLPRWAMGYWQSQERYETQDEMLSIVDEYRKRGIGLDSIVLDWCSWKGALWGQKTFDTERFPSPADMTKKLHDNHAHFVISIWPNMNKAGDNYTEFFDKGLLLPASEIYDAMNPEGRALYWKQANEGLFGHGVDAWWCDSSEPVTPEWSHKIKPEPQTMYREFYESASQYMPADQCNAYGFYHAQTMYEGQRGVTQEKRVVNLTRNAYTGQQRFGAVLWSGDISATWDTLRAQIPAGLNLSVSGLPFWTLDAGGFFVRRGEQWFWDGDYETGWNDLGYCELSVRWFQYAALLPVFRGHGTDFRREWWQAGEAGNAFYDALVATNRLRYRLLPYLYSTMAGVWLRDEMMMKPLACNFAHDARALDCKDQFLLGDALMACPVTQPMDYDIGSKKLENVSHTRQVYLPEGSDWVNYWTHTYYRGGQTITAKAPLARMPLFVKAGSIVPVCNATQHTEEAAAKECTLLIFAGADADFAFYDDAGDGYDYESGAYALTPLHWDDAASRLRIGETQGSYKDGADPHTFQVEIIRDLGKKECAR